MSYELTADGSEALELRSRPAFGCMAVVVVLSTILAVVWFVWVVAISRWFAVAGSLPMIYCLYRFLTVRALDVRFDRRTGTLTYRRSGAAGSRKRETVEEIPLSEVQQLFVAHRPRTRHDAFQLLLLLRGGRTLPLSDVDLFVDRAQESGERIRRFLGLEPIVRVTTFGAPPLP